MIRTLVVAAAVIYSAHGVKATPTDIVVGGHSLRAEAIAGLEAEERDREKDNAAFLADPTTDAGMRKEIAAHGKPYCGSGIEWRLLSVVGPLVSVRRDESTFCFPAAHPWGGASFMTYDARTAKPASLAALYDDKTLLAALTRDKLVAKALAGAKPGTTAELLERVSAWSGPCEYAFSKDMLQHFAFHHVEGNRVAVRIGLSHGCEAARGMLTELGILLPITPTLRPWLKDALLYAHAPTQTARLNWGANGY